MKNHWKNDIIAGFVIFLIALPLSIGIALAAGVPASAGILSAILGGIIGTLITGSHISINGPAAGLIVVISTSVISLGGEDLALGFKRTLAATVVAGVLQILLGVLRLGSLAFFCPTSVVHGMLAAIGTIIMVKQTPVLLGVTPVAKSITGIVAELPHLIMNNDMPIFLTGIVCIFILLIWKKLPQSFTQFVPGPLAVVAAGLTLSYVLDVEHPHNVNWLEHGYHLGPEFLVHVPKSMKEMFIFPTFDIIFTIKSLISIITIFIVGSLESLLSAFAIDKLDPYKRKSNLNVDIIGKGVTNIFCGLLGAYPIITEIVRSSANISNGAKTKWSNFFHGIFILIFVALMPDLINHIPLSALAAVLILVGFNLAHPRQFKEVLHHGKDQFFLFSLTMIVTLVEDLLIGIAIGILAKLILHFVRGVKIMELFYPIIEVEHKEEKSVVHVKSNIVFLGYLKVKKILESEEFKNDIELNKKDYFIDFTISELLKEHKIK
jgi:MFS superfamily sulfate permease-like transporter